MTCQFTWRCIANYYDNTNGWYIPIKLLPSSYISTFCIAIVYRDGPLDTEFRSSVVGDWHRFPIYNRFFTATSQKLFKESSLQLWHVTCQVTVFLRFFLLQMSIATCDCRIQHTLGNVFHDKVLLILQGSRFCCKIKCNIVNPPKAVIN